MIIILEQFLNLNEDDNDVYIYDRDSDFLDCGLGCHTKYFECTILSIWVEKDTSMNHICVKIDW